MKLELLGVPTCAVKDTIVEILDVAHPMLRNTDNLVVDPMPFIGENKLDVGVFNEI